MAFLPIRTPSILRLRLLAACVSATLVFACTLDPFTGERQVSKTAKGAAVGAAVGTAGGLLLGDNGRERRKRALIGGGVGALAGGAVGAYMDRQESKLRQELQGTGVSVTRIGDHLVLNMPGNITFASAQSDVKSSFYPVLNSVARVTKEFDKTMLEVAGHTDSTGDTAFNYALSERRAEAVAQYLKAQGVRDLRLLTVGYGPSRPVTGNETPEGRAQNRRVELRLMPLTQ